MKAEYVGNAVSIRQLSRLARRQNIVVQVSKHKEAVDSALNETHWHLICQQEGRQEQYGGSQADIHPLS
jgi:hypothetical protein